VTEPGLVLVIPAKDEAATIGRVVQEAVACGFAVLVVDDGSTDGTGPRAEACGARVLRNPSSLGYDPAIAGGINSAFAAGALAVATCDADGQHRMEDVVRVAAPVLAGQADLAAGIRDRYNRPVEWLVGLFSRHLFGTRDPFCGLKCYARSLHQRCGPFPAELNIGSLPLAWARNLGARPVFLPIRCPRRADRPRFGTALRANLRLARAFLRTWGALGQSPMMQNPPST
jgi:glycosyltransferase involved in cell wall biosynthesis